MNRWGKGGEGKGKGGGLTVMRTDVGGARGGVVVLVAGDGVLNLVHDVGHD